MTDAPTLYTAHDVPDLLNALPTLFGFRPRESLVAIATSGPRRRFGFRLRVDIPPTRHVDELARLVVSHLRNQEAEGAVLVAVTEQQDMAELLLGATAAHLHEIELVIAVRADENRYWVDAPDFPADGIAYDLSDHHLSIVKAIAAGQQILPDREALVARFAPVENPRRQVMMQLTEAAAVEIAAAPEVTLAMEQLGRILERGVCLTDVDAARLSAWVFHPHVRDAFWSLMTRDNAAEMLSVLTRVSSVVVPPFEPAVLSLTAFAGWLSGDGAQALIAVERALEVDPHCSMAHGVLQLLEGAVSPAHWGRF